MPINVVYDLEFRYPRDERGTPFPILPIDLAAINQPGDMIARHAYLDSGAEYSVFATELGLALGLDLRSGARRVYATSTRHRLDAAVRRVLLLLGRFELDLGFSEEVSRNLLGRDVFNLVQVGFRERYLSYYITPRP